MNLWLPGRKDEEEGMVREFRMDRYTLLYLKWIRNNKQRRRETFMNQRL